MFRLCTNGVDGDVLHQSDTIYECVHEMLVRDRNVKKEKPYDVNKSDNRDVINVCVVTDTGKKNPIVAESFELFDIFLESFSRHYSIDLTEPDSHNLVMLNNFYTSKRTDVDALILTSIRNIFAHSRNSYGYTRRMLEPAHIPRACDPCYPSRLSHDRLRPRPLSPGYIPDYYGHQNRTIHNTTPFTSIYSSDRDFNRCEKNSRATQTENNQPTKTVVPVVPTTQTVQKREGGAGIPPSEVETQPYVHIVKDVVAKCDNDKEEMKRNIFVSERDYTYKQIYNRCEFLEHDNTFTSLPREKVAKTIKTWDDIPVLFATKFAVYLYMNGKDLEGHNVRPNILDCDTAFETFQTLYSSITDEEFEMPDDEDMCLIIDNFSENLPPIRFVSPAEIMEGLNNADDSCAKHEMFKDEETEPTEVEDGEYDKDKINQYGEL